MTFNGDMTTSKMLQILIDGQGALRRDMTEGQNSLKEEMRTGFKKVNKRLDIIGLKMIPQRVRDMII